MATENLSQKELAKRLNVTTMQVRNLTNLHEMPRNPDGSYPWPETQEWYLAFKLEERDRRSATRSAPSELDQERARKERFTAGIREIELEKQLGNLVTLDFHVEKLGEVVGIIRKQMENLPSMAPRFVGLSTPAEAQRRLEELRDDMLAALRRTAEEIDSGDADSSDSDPELAA